MADYARYSVNDVAQPNGDHEVHKEGCHYFPANYTHLGYYNNCAEAVKKARNHYRQVNGCAFCARECHTG